MLGLEILGGIFSIAGAYLISKATDRALYLAFTCFFVSNLSLLAFFTLHGKVPMIIQMIFFFSSAILGVLRLSKKRVRDKGIIVSVLGVYAIILGSVLLYKGVQSIDFEIIPLDLVAATMAIVGSFLLSSSTREKRNIAYILFVLADILFVYIGYENAFYIFMMQSAFYIYTSSVGLYNNNKLYMENKDCATA